MAREKGMGSLQREKSGRWTMRVGINGKRYCRSTRTKDRDQAERVLQRFLAPLGLGERRLPLAEVWLEYVKSPNRNDLASTTLNAKRLVWMQFAKWMEHNYLFVSDLGGVTADMIGEYLACLRTEVCASTYNGRVCVLREIFRLLATKAGLEDDPWEGVRLRPDDCHSRRELTMSELQRLLESAKKMDESKCEVEEQTDQSLTSDEDVASPLKAEKRVPTRLSEMSSVGLRQPQPSTSTSHNEWHTLFLIGIYTGLRLGDCCKLDWSCINIAEGIIQLIPSKTRRHAHGQPITIPIHQALGAALVDQLKQANSPNNQTIPSGPVLPHICDLYQRTRWQVNHAIAKIFKQANIVTSVRIEGRHQRTPEATFHSLRHTFVSLAANAGIPLHVVQSIVGHESTAMTRHYYHESIDALRKAVNAIPII